MAVGPTAGGAVVGGAAVVAEGAETLWIKGQKTSWARSFFLASSN